MLEHAGCISVAAIVWEVKPFSLFICHQCLALYLLFFPPGKQNLKVELVRIHNQNEKDVLLMLYMACVSGILLYTNFFSSPQLVPCQVELLVSALKFYGRQLVLPLTVISVL